jgi:hypothetical protein
MTRVGRSWAKEAGSWAGSREKQRGSKEGVGRNRNGYRKFFSNFLRFGVQKSKDFDIFKLDLN